VCLCVCAYERVCVATCVCVCHSLNDVATELHISEKILSSELAPLSVRTRKSQTPSLDAIVVLVPTSPSMAAICGTTSSSKTVSVSIAALSALEPSYSKDVQLRKVASFRSR